MNIYRDKEQVRKHFHLGQWNNSNVDLEIDVDILRYLCVRLGNKQNPRIFDRSFRQKILP